MGRGLVAFAWLALEPARSFVCAYLSVSKEPTAWCAIEGLALGILFARLMKWHGPTA